jgi:hypothetical protein
VTAPHNEVAEEVGTEGLREMLSLYIDESWWKVRDESARIRTDRTLILSQRHARAFDPAG